MSGYTKVHASLIHSTVWREPDHVRIVWMTMLAMADRDGIVEASVPGLADAARKSIEDTEKALARLMEPDPYSRTPDHEGRRIEPVRGGWRLLNHGIYRDKASVEESREKAAARQARKRERDASRSVTPSHAESRSVTPVTQSHDIAEAEASSSPSESRAPARVASVMPRAGSSLSGLRDPMAKDATCSSEEYPWQAFRAEGDRLGMVVPPHPTWNDRKHVLEIERAALHAAKLAHERTGRAEGDAFARLVTLALREYAKRRADDPKRHPWKIGFVASAWAELTKGAIPGAA
jgi:hypothetical protein